MTTRTGIDCLRQALALRGESTASLTNDAAVIARWRQVVAQIGGDGADELQRQANAANYERATGGGRPGGRPRRPVGAVAPGMSNYARYLGSRAGRSNAEVDRWFEDIRLGCERARAAGP